MEVTREIVFPDSPDAVWKALTEAEQLEEWFANDVELDPREGGDGVFRWDDGEERRAKVLVAEHAVPTFAGIEVDIVRKPLLQLLRLGQRLPDLVG